MKSRNREINIFNMSLLDILCGALGAFCFMMIVLLPYYKPSTEEDQHQQEKTDKTVKDIKELLDQMKDVKNVEDLRKLLEQLKARIKELEDQIKEMQGRINKLVADNEQLAKDKSALQRQRDALQREKDALQRERDALQRQRETLKKEKEEVTQQRDKAQKEANQLRVRRPGVVKVSLDNLLPFDQSGFLDLYLWEDFKSDVGQTMPPYNPAAPQSNTYFNGSTIVWSRGFKPNTYWLYRDVVKERMAVYVQLHISKPDATDPKKEVNIPLTSPLQVSGSVATATPKNFFQALPVVKLTPEHPWILVCFIDCAEDGTLTVKEATAEEREAEWKKLEPDK